MYLIISIGHISGGSPCIYLLLKVTVHNFRQIGGFLDDHLICLEPVGLNENLG